MARNEQICQASLLGENVASPLPDAGPDAKPNVPDLGSLKTELEDIAKCHVSLKFSKKLDVGVSVHLNDRGFAIQLNPKAFRSKRNAEDNLNFLRKMVGVTA